MYFKTIDRPLTHAACRLSVPFLLVRHVFVTQSHVMP